jgi:hypothetical protein
MNRKSSILLFMLILVFYVKSVLALTQVPLPTEPIYFEPPVVHATEEQKQLNCVALDDSIRYIQPYRYSYKPNFHEDEANKVAALFVIVDSIPIVEGWLGMAYLGYSALLEEKEQRRVLAVEQQVAMLQQLKAQKHCFE